METKAKGPADEQRNRLHLGGNTDGTPEEPGESQLHGGLHCPIHANNSCYMIWCSTFLQELSVCDTMHHLFKNHMDQWKMVIDFWQLK